MIYRDICKTKKHPCYCSCFLQPPWANRRPKYSSVFSWPNCSIIAKFPELISLSLSLPLFIYIYMFIALILKHIKKNITDLSCWLLLLSNLPSAAQDCQGSSKTKPSTTLPAFRLPCDRSSPWGRGPKFIAFPSFIQAPVDHINHIWWICVPFNGNGDLGSCCKHSHYVHMSQDSQVELSKHKPNKPSSKPSAWQTLGKSSRFA